MNATRFASSVVQVSASASAGEVIIKVVDDGPGIPEAALHAALLRGVQLDSKGGQLFRPASFRD